MMSASSSCDDVAHEARALKLFSNTPLIHSAPLSKLCQSRPVYLKLDCLQRSGSFKDRGMAHLCASSRLRLISSSGGNAGLAITTVASLMPKDAIDVAVIVPQTTKPLVIAKLRSLGADVTVHGTNWNSADAAIIAGSPTTSFSSIPITTTTRRRYPSKTSHHRLSASSSKSSQFDSPIINYYDILGADSTMSRAEIRQRYIALARTTHPDSSGDDTTTTGNNSNNNNSFDTVARAWEVLSNTQSRRVHDRELAALEFKENISRMADVAVREVGPTLNKFYDDVAIPLFRRSAATTLAGCCWFRCGRCVWRRCWS